ncbi:hypothetical protein SDC9_154239 [bioreactor metagenome]|uniref:PEGA domain-containing protein n=1 Tax=bioreactor metagenome TaxID=1076179 RepID=A0A645F0G1_9ZZZZ
MARLEKTHGHLVIKNLDKVENAIIKVDGEVVEVDKDSGMIEIAEGEHKVVVSGTNIEDYETTLVIMPNDKKVIDINENETTQKSETGAIKLNVSPSGYTVVLDGVPYLQSTTEIYAEKGEHKVEIVKPGYETSSVKITLADRTVEVNIRLEKLKVPEEKKEASQSNLSVYSNPGWAKVYIDGEYIGIAPVMAKLSYGEHYIKAELDGYDEFKTHVTVDSPDKAITAEFE